MLARTNKFKEEIVKLGKQIDSKINVYTNDKIITENNEFLMTENNLHLVVEQFSLDDIDEVINSEDIYNLSIVRKGNLLSTMMQEFDFEIVQDLRVGDVVDYSFGLKVNDDYEYIDYGKFVIFSKEHNEDTNTYSYVAYDSMLLSMIEVDDTSIIQGVTVQQAIENICEKVGLSVNITSEDITNYPNLENIINEEAFNNIEMTYRDVLDMICQCLGVSMVSNNNTLYLKQLNNNVVDTFNEEYLKDVNVKFSDKYMINSVVLSRSEDTDTIYRRDEESIELNGLHEFKIKDNLIMNFNDREDYIDEIFNQLNGVEFYINDFTSTGITYLEPLDFYNVTIADNTYKCLLLNDEIKIQQGLEENIYTEMPEETTTEYKTSSKTDKEVSFIVDKQNGRISSKVSQNDIIASLNVAIEDGQGIVELKGNTVTINSDNFILDEKGNMICNEATATGLNINGGNITLTGKTANDKRVSVNYSYDGNTWETIMAGQHFRMSVNNETRAIYGSDITLFNGNNALSLDAEYIGFQRNGTSGPVSINSLNGNITCVSLTQTSKEKDKKNFEKYENALEQVKNTDIYKYNFKTENDEKKKHIGFVIGDNFDYSHDITAVDENNNEIGVDTYSMVSVLWKAVKEQQEQIEELKQEIKSLKGDDI